MLSKLIHGVAAALSFMAILLALPASADPIKAESENIVLYGDVAPGHAADLLQQLEVYRRMIYALSDTEPGGPDAVKLTIYGFDKVRGVQDFAGKDTIAGVYKASARFPVFLTTLGAGGGTSNQTALHEYSHHVLRGVIKDTLPRWYNEGFANYLATLEVGEDRIVMGAPTLSHVRNIDTSKDWHDPKIVLGAIHRYPLFSQRKSVQSANMAHFYAQSWLYVHMLQNTPELGSRLPDYLAALESGVDPIAAFEQGYGLSVDDFHARAEAYWDTGDFPVIAFEPTEDMLRVDVATTPLTRAQLNRAQIDGQRVFLNDANAKAFSKRVRRALKDMPVDPVLASARAMTLVQEGKHQDARELIRAALAEAPNDVDVNRAIGEAQYHLLQNSERNRARPAGELRTFETGPDFDSMAQSFAVVLAADPTDPLATERMVSAFAMSDAPMTGAARTALESFEATNTSGAAWHALDLAVVHHKSGNTRQACRYLDYARSGMSAPGSKKMAWLDAQLAYTQARVGPSCATVGQ